MMKDLYSVVEGILDDNTMDNMAVNIEKIAPLDKKFKNIKEVAAAFQEVFGPIVTKPIKVNPAPSGFGRLFNHDGPHSNDGQYVKDNFEVVVNNRRFRFGDVDNGKNLYIQLVYKDYRNKSAYGYARQYKYGTNFLQWLTDLFDGKFGSINWSHERDIIADWLERTKQTK